MAVAGRGWTKADLLWDTGGMSRIRVCHILTDLAPAGTERSVYELARRLDRNRFDVSVIGLRGGAVADRLVEAGIDVDVLGVRHKLDAFKLARLVRMLRSRKPDIVHTHLFHADLVGRTAAKLAGVRRLVHSVRAVERRIRPWQFAWARLTAGACDMTLCVSEPVREHYLRRTGLPASRVRVIHNGIDAGAWAGDGDARLGVRQERAIGADELVGGFIGRLHPDKGTDVLMRAWERLGGAAPRLLIAGDGPMQEELLAWVRTRARAEWLGHVNDVHAVVSAVDFLVMPSRTEGLPVAALEAMAAGLPVVASRAGGLAELVVDGQTGLLVPPEAPDALADAVRTLSNDAELRHRMGQAGRARVETHFHIDATVSAHETLYAELTGQGAIG